MHDVAGWTSLVYRGMNAAWPHALEGVGIEVGGERQVLVLEVEDRPGAPGEVSRRMANAAANIDLLCVASNSGMVIGADDLDKARAVV